MPETSRKVSFGKNIFPSPADMGDERRRRLLFLLLLLRRRPGLHFAPARKFSPLPTFFFPSRKSISLQQQSLPFLSSVRLSEVRLMMISKGRGEIVCRYVYVSE